VVEIDDEALVAGIAGGSERAFEEFLTRHIDAIHGYTQRLTGSRDDADELTQETFLRVWQRAGSYQPGRVRVTTWLHTIAHHLCVDRWRRPAVEAADDADLLPDPAPGPAGELERARLAARLDQALARLPLDQKAALLLAEVRGLSLREVAAVLGGTVDAAESRLARARRALRSVLDAP
jgi:RNA polymerase sigma-70 factor (ECF subfamily)